jgi:thiosulfate reductase/polysulfide reductase chain A
MTAPLTLDRREWLGLMAAAPFFKPAQALAADDIRTVTTACGVCSPGCGIQATVRNGTVTFLQGLPGDTIGQGRLCGKGAAGAGFLYDPDRLKYPMKRTNPKKGLEEDPGWVRITWQEALDTIATRFGDSLKQFGAESLLFVTLPAPDVWARFMNAIGVVNRVDHIDECFLTDRIIQRYTTGGKTWGNDFENSKYILLFGWDILTKTKIPYSQGIVAARDNGARIVSFNPEYSTMSRFADEWYAIRPGTDLAVALAIINVLIGENIYNKEFVDKYTNFAEHEARIRAHFQEYSPEWAETISGVPAADIRRIARDFASNGPAIVPAHKKTLCANYQNASQLVHAISILNILAGTVDRPGGRYFPRAVSIPGVDAVYPPPAYPPKRGRYVDGKDKLPFVLEDGGGMFSTLADGILNRYPGMIQCCFFNAYTVLGFPNPPQMFRALETIPFTVVMDFLPTDTTAFADIVLPSAMYLEVNDLIVREYVSKYPQVVARQALAPPIFEARGAGYVALELGKRMAPDYFKKADGTFFNLNELLDEKTKRANLGTGFADFVSRGGVFTRPAPFVPRETFATRNGNGKCQIFVPDFEAKGADALPKWRPRRDGVSAEYPIYYLTFIPGIHKRNTTENNRILNEMMDTNQALLNPALALRLGVKEGQRVRITSRVGSIELPAHLTETLRPDSVMVAHGFGHRSRLLRAAAGKGVRDGDVIAGQSAQDLVDTGNYAGAACIMDAAVKVEAL